MKFAPSAAGLALRALAAAVIDNLAKVPFLDRAWPDAPVDAVRGLALAPIVVLLGGLLGYAKVLGISQSRFDLAVLAASALAGSALLLVQERERGAQMAAYSTT